MSETMTKNISQMSTAEKRATLRQKMDELDDKFIEAIYAIVAAYEEKEEEDPIIGYDVTDGSPVRASVAKEQFAADLEAVKRGEYITVEDLEKESETW